MMFDGKQKEGYLYKPRGQLKKWRKRWFVLSENRLYSFKDRNDRNPTETIDLKVFNCLDSSEKISDRPHCFYVFSTYLVFFLAGENERESKDWAWAIVKAIVLSHMQFIDNEEVRSRRGIFSNVRTTMAKWFNFQIRSA